MGLPRAARREPGHGALGCSRPPGRPGPDAGGHAQPQARPVRGPALARIGTTRARGADRTRTARRGGSARRAARVRANPFSLRRRRDPDEGPSSRPGTRSRSARSAISTLVENPAEAQAQLIAAGFEEVDDLLRFQDIHHLRPLWWPGLPLGVELHSRPNWPIDLPSPPTSRILAAAVPVADGVKMLPPAYHALLVAAHSWRHGPLSQLRDMIDVVVMAEAAGRDSVSALAREWGVERLWRSTIRAADAAVLGAEWPTGCACGAEPRAGSGANGVREPRHALAERLLDHAAARRSPARPRRSRRSSAPREGAPGEPSSHELRGQSATPRSGARPRRSGATPLVEDARLDIDLGFREREHLPCGVEEAVSACI